MFSCNRSKQLSAASHPDPGVALKLRHIQALLGLYSKADEQIQLYLAEIEFVHAEMNRNSSARRAYYQQMDEATFNGLMKSCKERIAAAEAGIATCREGISDVQRQVDEYTASANLTTFDLAYLNLSAN